MFPTAIPGIGTETRPPERAAFFIEWESLWHVEHRTNKSGVDNIVAKIKGRLGENNPNWLRQEKRYDWPSRSQRGRIITTAFHWQIPDHFDVMHEAADDLVRTQFHPIRNVLDNMDYDIFEDHQMIIADMVLR